METKKFLDGEGLKTLWNEITSLQSDYNETDETSPNYIKNKPFTIDVIPEEVIEEFTFTTSDKIDNSTGLPTMQYVQLFSDLTIGQKMNLQFTYPQLAAATGQPQYDDNGNIITKTVRYENIEVGNLVDAMGSQFLDSPAIMMGPGALIETLPESIQRIAIPNDDIIFIYSNATLSNGTKVPLLITTLMDWFTGNYSTYVATCSISTFTIEKIDLVASRENHIALQSDWDEWGKENSAYIKNKPFGDEIILTPKNEFYRNSFIEWYGDDKSGFGNPGYSLQAEPGKQYTLQAFDNDGESGIITLTCVDHTFAGATLPEGAYLLGDFNNQGQLNSLTFLVDKVKFDSTQENMIYDENSCLIVFTDELYKIVIHDTSLEGTYERVAINKINAKYLPKADQSYNWTSENAQSGIAVNEAISKVKNGLPNSVVTSLAAPTTLGDQHVKVQFDSTNSNTYPSSATWDIYTEGIGLNTDLSTSSKTTIVDAINENVSSIDKNKDEIKRLKTYSNTKLDSILDNHILVNYDITTKTNNFLYLSNKEVEENKISSQLYTQHLLDATMDNIYLASTEDGFVWYDKKNYKVYRMSNGIISLNRDYSQDLSYQKISNEFFSNGSHVVHYIDTLPKNGQERNELYIINSNGSALCIGLDSYSWFSRRTYDGVSAHRQMCGSCRYFYRDALRGTSYSLFMSNNSTGKFYFILNGNLLTVGQDSWSNIQSLDNFTRVLDENGIEQVIIRVDGKILNEGNVFTNIDNNNHSAYCYINNNIIACLSSSQEILFRNKDNGNIVHKILLPDDIPHGLCSNLQFCATYFYKNCFYIIKDKAIYKISNLHDIPIINCVNLYSDAYTRQCGDIKLINDCLMFYDYARYSPKGEKSHFLFGLPLREILEHGQEQSNYDQNDSTQPDYIKNKPITAEYVTNYLTKDKSIPVAQQMGNSAFVVEDQFINLVIGEKYDIDMNVTSTVDNATITQTFKDVECVDMSGFWKQSSTCPGIVIAPELMLSLYPSLSHATLSESLVFMYTNNFNGAAYDETKCITCVGEIDETGTANTNITITVNVSQTNVEGEISEPYAKFLQADWSEKDEAKIGYIKNKPSTGDYYFFNLKDFADSGCATKQYAHAVKNPSSNVYNDYFALNVVLGLGGINGQTYYNITNIPYETLCINDYPYITDKHRFKNMGLKSPAFKQLLNYDGIVWFDAIEDCLRDILTDNFSSLRTITRQYSDMLIGFVIYGETKRSSPSTMNPKVQQIIGLWDAVLNDPDTQIVIEYQNSQNVQHIEGQLIMPVAELEEVE